MKREMDVDFSRLKKLKDKVMSDWEMMLLNSCKLKLETSEKKARNNLSNTLFPYLKLFPANVYVDIILKTVKQLLVHSDTYR